jgi:octaprenyl-diphosphate synthase
MSDFSATRNLVEQEQVACDNLIKECLRSRVELINQVGDHIVESGGKRLRPLLVLLAAKAFGYETNFNDQSRIGHIQLAATIELFHTASLLHDDVVDHSELRRGKPTANKIWGEQASVLVGDYLYSRAFQLMVNVNNMKVLEIMAKASNLMAEGEVLQLLNCHNPDITQENYMQVIYHKTGTLFAAAAQMGPILTQQHEYMETMYEYGKCLGTAFQLVDDALDYSMSSEQMGKNMGDDLSEGKPTLPFIRALSELEKKNSSQASILREAVKSGKTENMHELIDIIQSTDAISYTHEVAKQQGALAIDHLKQIPASIYRESLEKMVEFAIARHY